MKTYKHFKDYINTLASDFKASGYEYAEDYAHECADSSEFVIYYSKAWELIDVVRSTHYDLFDEGEAWAFELNERHESLDSIMTTVAYGIIYTALVDTINEQEMEASA